MNAKRPMKCGFCLNLDCHLCPGGVRNGNGKIAVCACRCELAGAPRCTDCWTRDPEEIGPEWTCTDTSRCAARLAKRQKGNPTLVMMRQITAEVARKKALEAKAEKRERVAAAPKVKGQCRCCGKPTKGGNFQPGHDTKFLGQLLAESGTDSREIAYSISPAFGNKYDKRVKTNA